ncbi:MAG TPA: four helix bundle protein [Candidatus Peribacteraceae bacterium]|nr:four helix bundle protein [Candidatus Peribacteraceae bacterium]
MLQTVKNPLRAKSYEFALAIVNLYKRLQSDQREYVLSKQLLRSATSVGANVEEAQQAQSRRDFILKTSIAMKEAYESRYWLRLLQDGGYVPKEKN